MQSNQQYERDRCGYIVNESLMDDVHLRFIIEILCRKS